MFFLTELLSVSLEIFIFWLHFGVNTDVFARVQVLWRISWRVSLMTYKDTLWTCAHVPGALKHSPHFKDFGLIAHMLMWHRKYMYLSSTSASYADLFSKWDTDVSSNPYSRQERKHTLRSFASISREFGKSLKQTAETHGTAVETVIISETEGRRDVDSQRVSGDEDAWGAFKGSYLQSHH